MRNRREGRPAVYATEHETSFEPEKKLPDLRDYGMEPGQPASLEKVAELLQDFEREIALGIKRLYYRDMHYALVHEQPSYMPGHLEYRSDGTRVDMIVNFNSPFAPKEEGARKTRFVYYLPSKEVSESERGANPNNVMDQPRIELVFAIDEDFAKAREGIADKEEFEDVYCYEGMYLGANQNLDEDLVRIGRDNKRDYETLRTLEMDTDQLMGFLKRFLETQRDFSESEQTLLDLAEKCGIDKEAAELMAQAMYDFGNYTYRKEEGGLNMLGDCLHTPNMFVRHCRNYGLRVHTARYGTYDPGTGQYMNGLYHEVNVFGRKIVIDWTVRQYGDYKDAPIPYVYPVGEGPEFLGVLHDAGYRSFDDSGMLIPKGYDAEVEYNVPYEEAWKDREQSVRIDSEV